MAPEIAHGNDWLDPEEFPFTEAELHAALSPWSRVAGLERLAADVASGLRDGRTARERALAAIARGSLDLEEVNYPIFLFPDDVWALMAELSSAHARRVELFFEERRAKQRGQRLAQAMHQAALDPRGTPPPEIVAQIEAEDREADAQWQALRVQVRGQVGSHGEATGGAVT